MFPRRLEKFKTYKKNTLIKRQKRVVNFINFNSLFKKQTAIYATDFKFVIFKHCSIKVSFFRSKVDIELYFEIDFRTF